MLTKSINIEKEVACYLFWSAKGSKKGVFLNDLALYPRPPS